MGLKKLVMVEWIFWSVGMSAVILAAILFFIDASLDAQAWSFFFGIYNLWLSSDYRIDRLYKNMK